MNKNLSILLLAASMGATSLASAQSNFTMQEAVLGLNTHLKVADIPQLGFWQHSNHVTRLEKNDKEQYFIVNKTAHFEDTVVRLSQLQALLKDEQLKNIPSIVSLNENEVYFRYKNDYYLISNNNSQRIRHWFAIDAKAENVTIDPVKKHVVYTVENNLYVRKADGSVKAITRDANPNIINGKSVHRNEFGINGGIFISPKGNYVAFYRMDESMVADYPIIDWSVTPAKNNNIKYPMAGEATHEVSIGVYHIATGELTYLKTPQPLKDYYLTTVSWTPYEGEIFTTVLKRNQREAALHQYNIVNGQLLKELFTETSDKYVEPQHPLTFLKNGKEFIYWSQKDGYMHLYRYNNAGKLLNQITKGEWIVKSIDAVNEDKQELIITTTKGSPLETAIYKVNYVTGKMTRLSQQKGVHQCIASHDGSAILDIWRNATTPKKIDWVQTNTLQSKNLLTASNPLANYNVSTVKNVTLKADDGTPLYGKLMLPKDFNPNKKYPVIVYLYNGPHLQLITNSFPASGNLWYDYMTQQGFIVFSMDGRGSANRGLAFEQAIHNQLGTVEMNDQLVGVNYLKSLPYIDNERMGVHGWSFGGFMTTSLMTRHPGVFKVGVAGGPVIDWTKYEIMYTERYMSSPQSNPTGYANNNLLNHAKNLEGKLLMIHGTDDDVVVWQHSIDFIKRCVDEGKQVDYFVYPKHAHNVRGKDRVHLMQKIADYFIQNL